MKIAIMLALASILAACAGTPDNAAATGQTSQALSRIGVDDPPPDDPGSGDGDDITCALSGVACAAAILTSTPLCVVECATVAACVVCGAQIAGTISACGAWAVSCQPHAARVGDACTVAYRCETNGLHCVDGACRTEHGRENQSCTADRDCQAGMSCVNDDEGSFCWRPRQIGESCELGSCAVDDGQGHPLTCDAHTHQCRRRDACTTHADCDRGSHCDAGTCVLGCLDDSQCLPGDSCVTGRCTHTDVTICNCDGTDASGTCIGACPGDPGTGTGGGPWGGGPGYGVTCYNFYDAYTVCADYQDQHECDTTYELEDSICI